VTDEVDHYPEADVRQRQWASIPEALGRVDEVGLRQIIRGVVLARAAG
jgi:hypothetical protein